MAFSFAPPVARAAILGGMDSNQLLMLRMVIATTLFGLTIAATARGSLRLPRQGLQAAIIVGAINAAGMILFFLSLNYLEASLGAMIIALSPPIVLMLLALRGERLTRRHLVRLGLALAGVYLLISPSGEVNWADPAQTDVRGAYDRYCDQLSRMDEHAKTMKVEADAMRASRKRRSSMCSVFFIQTIMPYRYGSSS